MKKLLLVITSVLLMVGCQKNLTRQIHIQPLLHSKQGQNQNAQGHNLQRHSERAFCQQNFVVNNQDEASVWAIDQLLFFMSDLQVQLHDDSWQPLSLLKTKFQTPKIALLGQYCDNHNQASSLKNWQITLANDIDLAEVKALRFTLGVPFSKNHLNPLTQESPLNLPSMFWVWQTGHKFLRLELSSAHSSWLFHLGSTGCVAASSLRMPSKACLYPNRKTFQVPITEAEGNGAELQLNFHLDKLLSKVVLASANNCQSQANNPTCQQLFTNLALTGNGAEQANSLIFTVVTDEKK